MERLWNTVWRMFLGCAGTLFMEGWSRRLITMFVDLTMLNIVCEKCLLFSKLSLYCVHTWEEYTERCYIVQIISQFT